MNHGQPANRVEYQTHGADSFQGSQWHDWSQVIWNINTQTWEKLPLGEWHPERKSEVECCTSAGSGSGQRCVPCGLPHCGTNASASGRSPKSGGGPALDVEFFLCPCLRTDQGGIRGRSGRCGLQQWLVIREQALVWASRGVAPVVQPAAESCHS